MLATRSQIENFIPQRNPFIAIDEIQQATDEFAITQFKVLAESIFVIDGVLGEPGLIENIAQTAAAQMGYVCKIKKLDVPIGYIASIKNLKIVELPKVGSVLTTSIQITNRVMNVIIVDGRIKVGDYRICECEMRIFVEQNDAVRT